MHLSINLLKWFYCLALASVAFACSPGKAKKESTLRGNSFQLPSKNIETGRLIYASTCKACHGESGEGNKKFQAPALVNTDAWYLYRQLINYRNGLRGYSNQDTVAFQMAAMAKTLKDSIAASDVVAYIKIMPGVIVSPIAIGDKKNGENIYQSICGSCHGPNAKGNEKLNAPRLSGLNDWYLKEQLRKFKNSIRGAHPDDKLGAQMIAMVAMLPDDQSVNDVIAYILSTTQPVSQ